MRLPVSMLAAAVSYCPERGLFWWLDRPDLTPTVRSRIVGKEAFITQNGNGYLNARVHGRSVYAHRAAWAICHGRWPECEVDHINGDRADNRIANLRDVSRIDNMRNVKRFSNNRSGVTGVTWNRAAKKWQAQIGADGGCRYLGLFADIDEAIAARCAAESEFGFHTNHGRLPQGPTRWAQKHHRDNPGADGLRVWAEKEAF